MGRSNMKTPPPISNSDLSPGTLVGNGKYQLIKRLAKGGNGAIWLAEHGSLQQHVVIKFPIRVDDNQIHQLKTEIQHLAKFSNRHPNIVNVLDVDTWKNRPLIVVQYLSNGSLKEYSFGQPKCASRGTDLHRNPNWLIAVANALDFLHNEGMMHRDVKPANILFDDSLSPYLSDFGIAESIEHVPDEQNQDDKISGSIPYMAPELLTSGTPSPQSDQFALGVTLFEFLTGRRPFENYEGSESYGQMNESKKISSVRTDLASEFCDVVDRSLSFDPQERFQTCLQFAEEALRHWRYSEKALHDSVSGPPESEAPTKSLSKSSTVDSSKPSEKSSEDAPSSEHAKEPKKPRKRKISLNRILRDQQ